MGFCGGGQGIQDCVIFARALQEAVHPLLAKFESLCCAERVFLPMFLLYFAHRKRFPDFSSLICASSPALPVLSDLLLQPKLEP